MTTPTNADPLTIYLMEGDRAVLIPAVSDFNLSVENPEVNDSRDDARQVNPRRAQQLRRRRANSGDIALTLDYDPLNELHQDLLAAGECDTRLTLRIAICDSTGQVASVQDIDCSVVRYTLSCRKTHRRRLVESDQLYTCEAELRLQRHGDLRSVNPGWQCCNTALPAVQKLPAPAGGPARHPPVLKNSSILGEYAIGQNVKAWQYAMDSNLPHLI